ncbi:hypothetical protein MML48_1g05840 [Holotrichia oblita]|uniref:Uncharacterized protein n=1 Tax=Holotrichia oblita TaxID=644536 RepID=A0ACB9TWD5_HOLOL|nr:hypothetical protein MML48_1g05840 [Holotrichia oblita]
MIHKMELETAESEPSQLLKKHLLNLVNRRLGSFETNILAAKVTYLDPRLNTLPFSVQEKDAQRWITEEIPEIMRDNQDVENLAETPTIPDASVRYSIWPHFDAKITHL